MTDNISNTNANSDRWENEGGAITPADDSNYDLQLEDNVKAAIRKRKNVVRMREIDMTDDDAWYHGC